MVPMRVNLGENPTFRDFLGQVRQVVLSALQNQDFPFPLLVERLGRRQHTNRSPIFQVTFDEQRVRADLLPDGLSKLVVPHGAPSRMNMAGLVIEAYPIPQQEGQFDLVLQVLDTNGTLPGILKYSRDIFDAATAQRIIRHFERLLRAIATDPDQPVAALPLLDADDRAQILTEWNDTATDYPAETGVHQLFEQQVRATPQAVAAIHDGQSITYESLNRRANQLAHHLLTLGVGPETLVGVHVERGLDMLVALLGVLKAGAAYVPMDPAFPRERLSYMIEDADMTLIISQDALVDQLPPTGEAQLIRIDSDWPVIANQRDDDPSTNLTGANLAYVIFTSGSTGRPKGVQIEHHSLTNFLLTMRDRPGLRPNDVMLALTTLSFDIAALELYLPLIVGARVVLLSREATWDGRQIESALASNSVTVMQATPASWQLLLESGWAGKADLTMFCGGEALPRGLADRLLRAGKALWNLYGPTETTIWSTVEQIVSAEETITIGRPIANTLVYVLDGHLQPVPPGVAGTLYIGGAGVARGYIKRPDLTAERFIDNPFGPGRIYNTGDMARWLADGRLECLGRVDHQVKIRGFRIELGEIEATLEGHETVQRTVVVAREDQPGDKRLVAYIVGVEGVQPDSSTLRDHVSTLLPNYMIPSAFVLMEAFPLTPNGKVDRRALPPPAEQDARVRGAVADAESPAEALLVGIWRGVLGFERVSVYDNFFDLGGHSLQVVQIVAAIEKETGIRLEPALMRYQTLRQQAATIESAGNFGPTVTDGVTTDTQRIHAPRSLELPFYFGLDDALFGVYYPAERIGDTAVVICNPWGQEFIRAHRACHQLALRLAGAGIPALRFDYYGTGDSLGDDLDANMARSLDDIRTAIAEVQRRSGASQVVLVGMRLGATFAVLAGPHHDAVERVVLWEPLTNGQRYLDELHSWHRRNLFYFLSNVSSPRNGATAEVLGFALSEQLVQEVEGIDLLANGHKPADAILVVEREAQDVTRQLCQRLEGHGAAVSYQRIDAPQMWTENVDKALVPHQTLEAIIDWIMKG
jgi:amino acid adenylation domain-containing protein